MRPVISAFCCESNHWVRNDEQHQQGYGMLNGAFALLERSLRIDSRAWSTHLTRLGLIAAIYFALCIALATQNIFGAPGLRFFQGIAYLDVTFMTLLGLGFFSTTITEEKEEDTLGLMLMAGISPLGILAGKTGGRLWEALLMVAVQYPFMLLAVTMGGVSAGQIRAATVALLAYMVFLAGFGLFCSTIAPRSRNAAGLMVVGLVAYVALPSIARGLLWFHAQNVLRGVQSLNESDLWGRLLQGTSEACVYLRMGSILETGFGQSPWSVQVISNSAMGLSCAALSWLLFGLATRNPSAESSSRGLVARQRAFFRFNAGRSWTNPFVWKDFYFVSGGIGMMFVRVMYYVGLGVVVFGFHYLWGYAPGPSGDSVEFYLILTSLSVAIDAAIVLARSMHDELRGQTISSLLMLPRSSIAIVYAKFAGALLGWLPGPVIELIVTLATEHGRFDFFANIKNEHGGWALIMLFVLIPHFAIFTALYVRWAAVPLAIGLTFGVYFAILGFLGLSVPAISNEVLLGIATFLMVCVCGVCHIGVLLRVQALGAK